MKSNYILRNVIGFHIKGERRKLNFASLFLFINMSLTQ